MASRTRLAGVLCVTALLAGCSHFSSSAAGPSASTSPPSHKTKPTASTSAPPTEKPPSPPPATDACRNLAYADIGRFSNNTKTTSCRKPHTSYTFDVRRLPDQVAFVGVSIGNDAVQSAAADTCRKSFGRFIGGDAAARALARLTVTYFVPRQADFDRGAHWVRCDVVALQSANVLAPLPRQVHGLLDEQGSLDRYGVCAKGEPGTETARLVMCSEDHAFRALAALRLGKGDAPYPPIKVVRVDGEQRCKDLVDSRLGPGGGYTYSWTYPSAVDWSSGQRFGYCWQKTAS
jgi:Septum formation